MGVHDGHRRRKKEQYRRQGLRGLADHEVLELLLYYAIPRRDTNEIAHRLLKTFGSLDGILNAPVEVLAQVQGMGEHSALLLHLVRDINYCAAVQRSGTIHMRSVEECGRYAMELMAGERQELLYQFCIDTKGKLVEKYLLAEGSIDSVQVNVQKVVANALNCGCTRVVLAHNHPGGIALASREDVSATLHLRDILHTMDIHLADHIVVADGDYVSLAQSGHLLF